MSIGDAVIRIDPGWLSCVAEQSAAFERASDAETPMRVLIDRNMRFTAPFPRVIYHEPDKVFPMGAWTVVTGRWVIMYTPRHA
jgi:hypothetical protein